MKYATWYRDEAGLHTAADLVSVVFERSTDVAGFPGLAHSAEKVDPLATSCRAMQGVLSVSPKFFTEDSKMAALGGKWIQSSLSVYSMESHILLHVQRNVEVVSCWGTRPERCGC